MWYANYVMLDWMTSCSIVRSLTDILLERAFVSVTTAMILYEALFSIAYDVRTLQMTPRTHPGTTQVVHCLVFDVLSCYVRVRGTTSSATGYAVHPVVCYVVWSGCTRSVVLKLDARVTPCMCVLATPKTHIMLWLQTD